MENAQQKEQQPIQKKFYLIEESLLKTTIDLIEEMPLRLASRALPIIESLGKCPPVEIKRENFTQAKKIQSTKPDIK